MSLPESHTSLPTYFAPQAFEIVRAEATGVSYDLEQLNRIMRGAEFILHNNLYDIDDSFAILYRFAIPGPGRSTPDPNFHKSRLDIPYMDQTQLLRPPESIVTPNTNKGEIITVHPNVLQIEIQNTNEPFVRWLASTLMYPPAEEHRLRASPLAWIRQAKDSYGRIDRKNKFIKRTVAECAGAIILNPRSTGTIAKT
ncbi:MAG TPA: hypothetical protein VF733_03415 [Candidatus Saccharimonadales bacterium]